MEGDYLELSLTQNGSLQLILMKHNVTHSFLLPAHLNDNKWHHVYLK